MWIFFRYPCRIGRKYHPPWSKPRHLAKSSHDQLATSKNTPGWNLRGASQRLHLPLLADFYPSHHSFVEFLDNGVLDNFALFGERPDVPSCKFDLDYIFSQLMQLLPLAVRHPIDFVFVGVDLLRSPNPQRPLLVYAALVVLSKGKRNQITG